MPAARKAQELQDIEKQGGAVIAKIAAADGVGKLSG